MFSKRLSSASISIISPISMFFSATSLASWRRFIFARSSALSVVSFSASLRTNIAFPEDMPFFFAKSRANAMSVAVWLKTAALTEFSSSAFPIFTVISFFNAVALSSLLLLTVTRIPLSLSVRYPFLTIDPISALTATLTSEPFRFIPSSTFSPSEFIAFTSLTIFFLFVLISMPGLTSMSITESIA